MVGCARRPNYPRLLPFLVAAFVLSEIAVSGSHGASAAATAGNDEQRPLTMNDHALAASGGDWHDAVAVRGVNKTVTLNYEQPTTVSKRPDAGTNDATDSTEDTCDACLKVEGHNLTMGCLSVGQSAVRWDFKRFDSKTYDPVFSSGKFTGRSVVTYQAAKNKTYFAVTGVRKSDAGSYKCMHSTNGQSIRTVDLIVIAYDPMCNVNLTTPQSAAVDFIVVNEKEPVYVGCKLCITGKANVSMKCVDNGSVFGKDSYGGGEGTTSGASDDSSEPTKCLDYRRTIPSSEPFYDVRFTCQVSITFDQVILRTVNWQSKPLRIHYGPRKPTIERIVNNSSIDGSDNSSMSSVAMHGDRFRCSAHGFPPPTYKWTVADKFAQPGEEFVLNICDLFGGANPGLLESGNGTTRLVKFECDAKREPNTVSHTMFVNVSVVEYSEKCKFRVGGGNNGGGGGGSDGDTVKQSQSASMTQYSVIGGAAGSALLVSLVITVVVVRRCKSRGHKSDDVHTKNKPDVHVFYNDAVGELRCGPYEEMPDYQYGPAPGLKSGYSIYDEPVETLDGTMAANTTAVLEVKPGTKSYQGLENTSREPPQPPAVYSELHTASNAKDKSAKPKSKPYDRPQAETYVQPPTRIYGVIDKKPTEVESRTKPHGGLENASRELPQPPDAYNKLQNTASEVKSGTKAYEGLRETSREPPKPPAVYKELHKTSEEKYITAKPKPKPKTYDRLPAETGVLPLSTQIYDEVNKTPAATSSTDKNKPAKPMTKPKTYERLPAETRVPPTSSQIYSDVNKQPAVGSSTGRTPAAVHPYVEVVD